LWGRWRGGWVSFIPGAETSEYPKHLILKKMIHFFIGTKAQFIKMAPLMAELQKRKIPFRYVDSGQHAALTRSLRGVFGLEEPDICLREKREDIASVSDAIFWYLKYLAITFFNPGWLRKRIFPEGGICLIHGDTLSTLLGMQMARRAGLAVGHVEAGLRSFRIWDPFPEELIRICCMRYSQVLFAPSGEAFGNLRSMNIRGRIVRTSGNTVADALLLTDNMPVSVKIPEKPFALATCHRLETITKKHRLGKVVALLNRAAEQMPLIFVRHKPTRRYLRQFYLENKLDPNIIRMDMLDYGDFVALLKKARCVLTDGGSIQEECAYLDKPCLIIRNTTERSDGMGRNATLWAFDEGIGERFLSESRSHLANDPPCLPCPSAQIADALIGLGYGGKR